ncbi:unnamed protein product [Allacma fusca]|uniref:Uncharacterized protein n=1 Tax=Allacma fusca TaxID=39272 RepID=A0A8J2KJP2_9HEXA|nr:unnamed protein product [Allacma fusca]
MKVKRRGRIILLLLFSLIFQTFAAFDESHFVNTNKNKLIRRTISLKEANIGKAAVLEGSCDTAKYNDLVRDIYKVDGNLSIFERSDRLFNYLTQLENDTTKTLRKETCGANHLMYCNGGTCNCMGDDPATYPEYSALKKTEIGTINGNTYHECRVRSRSCRF